MQSPLGIYLRLYLVRIPHLNTHGIKTNMKCSLGFGQRLMLPQNRAYTFTFPLLIQLTIPFP